MKGFLLAQALLRCNDRTFAWALQVVPPTETVDAFGYAINYFSGDYRAIGGNQSFEVNKYNSNFENNSHNLYNGNIKQITMALMTPCGERLPELGTNYYYDQLNRIKSSVVYYGGYFFQQSYLSWEGISASSDYYTSYDYDPNGNITRLVRNGYANSGQLNMDDLVYHYDPGTNRLLQVNDAISSTNYSSDIDNQTSSTNYHYDHIGNLIEDESEGISTSWNVYGKVKQVQKTDGTTINFAYDATGNRIKKQVKQSSDSVENYYVRDAQGNVMAMYELRRDTFWLTEQDLYGSSRLGVKQYWIPLNYTTFDTTRSTELLGFKQYELTNHLGNVEVTVSDRRIPHLDIDSNIIYYDPDVRTMIDYYPFGMEMPGRVANLLDVYSVTDTVSTPEPLTVYGSNPYTSTANMAFTLPTATGKFDFSINLDMTSFSGDIEVTIRDDSNHVVFTCTAHSSQVIYQVTASRVPVTCTDYTATAEPLGMYTGSFVIQFSPVLHYTTRLDWVCSTSGSINYRYGYNGKEKINELKGEGNSYDFGERIYDPRLGVWLSIDKFAFKYPANTPYCNSLNNPIALGDPDGHWVESKITRYLDDAMTKVKPWWQFWVKAKVVEKSYIIHDAVIFNGSELKTTPEQFNQAVGKIRNDVEQSFKTDINLNRKKYIVSVKFDGDIKILNDKNELDKLDMTSSKCNTLFYIAPSAYMDNNNMDGGNYIGTNLIYLSPEAAYLKTEYCGAVDPVTGKGQNIALTFIQTAAHEVGHMLGLGHINDKVNSLMRKVNECGLLKVLSPKTLRKLGIAPNSGYKELFQSAFKKIKN